MNKDYIKFNAVTQLASGRFVVAIDRAVRRHDGTSIRVKKRKALPRGTTLEEAQQVYEEMNARLKGDPSHVIDQKPEWASYVDSLVKDKQSWLYQTVRRAKYRDEKKGRASTLTVDQVEMLLLQSKGKCTVTGLPFNLDKVSTSRTAPFSPSIDRVDNAQGYSLDNVRVVCVAANFAMSNWGPEIFDRLATGYVLNKFGALKTA